MLAYYNLPFEIIILIAKISPQVMYLLAQVDKRITQYIQIHIIELQDIFTTITNGEYRLPNKWLHRNSDKPAITSSMHYEWWVNGLRHRDGDLPAVVYNNGYSAWYKNGVRHRSGGKPAIIYTNGNSTYWENGSLVPKSKNNKINLNLKYVVQYIQKLLWTVILLVR
jgi:ribosomal protein L25 (general stress protein Ctc)